MEGLNSNPTTGATYQQPVKDHDHEKAKTITALIFGVAAGAIAAVATYFATVSAGGPVIAFAAAVVLGIFVVKLFGSFVYGSIKSPAANNNSSNSNGNNTNYRPSYENNTNYPSYGTAAEQIRSQAQLSNDVSTRMENYLAEKNVRQAKNINEASKKIEENLKEYGPRESFVLGALNLLTDEEKRTVFAPYACQEKYAQYFTNGLLKPL